MLSDLFALSFLYVTIRLICMLVGQMAGSPVVSSGDQHSHVSKQGSDQLPSAAVKSAAQALAQGQHPSGASFTPSAKHDQNTLVAVEFYLFVSLYA